MSDREQSPLARVVQFIDRNPSMPPNELVSLGAKAGLAITEDVVEAVRYARSNPPHQPRKRTKRPETEAAVGEVVMPASVDRRGEKLWALRLLMGELGVDASTDVLREVCAAFGYPSQSVHEVSDDEMSS